MNDIIPVVADKPDIPSDWDFAKADKNFDKYIRDWRRLSIGVVSELWVFYQKLAFKTGDMDKSTNVELPTWLDWLSNKGISSPTPLRHFKALGWIKTVVHVSHNSGENEWYTPPKFVEAAKEVMGGVDVDPASSKIANETVNAKTYYDTESDGLEQKWKGRVWMNPPYSQPHISQFCNTLAKKLSTGEVTEACVLVNNATETGFGQKLLGLCAAVCFPSGRIKFLDVEGEAKGAPLQGQMILYYGVHSQHFLSEFGKFGVCLYHG